MLLQSLTMIEEIYSSFRRVLGRKIMETLKALILTITVLNLVSKGLSFYYNVMHIYKTLHDISNL